MRQGADCLASGASALGSFIGREIRQDFVLIIVGLRRKDDGAGGRGAAMCQSQLKPARRADD